MFGNWERDRRGYLILGFVGALLSGLVGLGMARVQQEVGADGCAAAGELKAHAILLVDVTEGFSEGDRRELGVHVKRLLRFLERDSKLTVLRLHGDQARPTTQVFSRCNPGAGHTFSKVDSNPTERQRVFVEDFVAPLEASLDALVQGEQESASPIHEALRRISLRKDFSSDVAERKLYVISDFIQWTHALHPRNRPSSYEEYAKSDRFVRYDFAGVELEMLYVRRVGYLEVQTIDHEDFWVEVLERSGADVKRHYW